MSEPQIDRMREAVAAVMAEDEDSPETAAGIVTGYVLVAECYGTDGKTWCSVYSGTEHAARTLGLLHWGVAQLQGHEGD